jgi:hypothetical protein
VGVTRQTSSWRTPPYPGIARMVCPIVTVIPSRRGMFRWGGMIVDAGVSCEAQPDAVADPVHVVVAEPATSQDLAGERVEVRDGRPRPHRVAHDGDHGAQHRRYSLVTGNERLNGPSLPMESEETGMTNRSGSNIGIRSVLLIIAIICFIVAALGIDVGKVSILAVGLAFFAGAFLVGELHL